MKYARVFNYVVSTPWAILPEKLDAIAALLVDRAHGIEASADELAAFVGPKQASPNTSGSVAVLPMRGVIAHRAGMLEEASGGVSTETFAKTYRALMSDASITMIVLDVDSPGGAVAGVHELAQEMLALKGTKKVIAVANSVMASAAYWLVAAAADEIVAIPSATVGSIGVASVHADISKKLEQDGIALDIFTSADNKADSLGLGPLSADGRARRQAAVDAAGEWFRADVAKGRGVSVADVRARFGEGAVFTAKDAKAAGLIDRIDTFDNVLGKLVGKRSAGGMRAEEELPAMALADDQEADVNDYNERLRQRLERF